MPAADHSGSSSDAIPLLDIGPYLAGDKAAIDPLARQLRDACENVGFHSIINHGVPRELIQAVFHEAARFHGQDLDEKLKVRINGDNIGYLPTAGDQLRSDGSDAPTKPNLNEAYFVRKDRSQDHPDVIAKVRFRGMNQWPPNLPGFRETVTRYFDTMEALSWRLLPIYARALGLPDDFFASHFDQPQATLRMSHYPPQTVADDAQFGLAPHTDSGFLTLLAPNEIAGLEIRTAAGTWLRVHQDPDAFMVNSGDMLHRWTNQHFRSTLHRVINSSGAERYAIPFFFNPSVSAPIECLPTCQGPDDPPKYPPTTYGEYYASFVNRHYPHQKANAAA